MLAKLNKLHQISLSSIPIPISHLAIIIIQLMHRTPILAISNTDYYHTQRQSTAFHQKVLYLLFVVDDSVS